MYQKQLLLPHHVNLNQKSVIRRTIGQLSHSNGNVILIQESKVMISHLEHYDLIM